jgi:hypothetical protein
MLALIVVAGLISRYDAAGAASRAAPRVEPAGSGRTLWPDAEIVGDSPLSFGGSAAKAVVDTVTLMGPGGSYPYRGDFESAAALPDGDGALPDGWTSIDHTAPEVHWHVSSHNNPGTGSGAACRDPLLPSCNAGDPVGGYGNSWRDILEFRKSVPGAATVRVQGRLRYDTEPGYDYVYLQRRTAAHPDFEPVGGGQGLTWDGQGSVDFDCTFTYAAGERVDGDQIAVALVFVSDGAFSDGDCLWPTDGAATVDDLVVTVTAGDVDLYVEDFEDGLIGPDWAVVSVIGVGDFARVWRGLCDSDPCADNPTNQVAFIDLYPDLWILPPPPGGCGMVNNTGGALGPGYHLDNAVRSPVMTLPAGGPSGLTLDFDVYAHELLIANDSPGIFYTWDVRSAAAGEEIALAGWRSRNFVYYGGPEYRRQHNVVDDLLVPGAERVQVQLGVVELGWLFGYGDGTNGTAAPYFDNVRVTAYPATGPRIVIDDRRLANDGFPGSGALDLEDLGSNSVRFDMAANIAPRSHLRNDPGDSICIDAAPRDGATLDAPQMHWTFAFRNPLFDPFRSLPANPVAGRVTRTAAGAVVANRWNFDLPDSGFLFPGDVLHYYFSATDHQAGDTRTATMPADLTSYGCLQRAPGRIELAPLWPSGFTVRCLPSVHSAEGWHPGILFWNDQGSRGAEDEWLAAFYLLHAWVGDYVDIFTTRAPTSGLGNGLGGRATVAQLAGYSDLIYTAGDLSSPTLSNGDYNADPGNDLALLNGWLALGGRDMLLCGEDLANSLYSSGTTARAFLETTMGLQYVDADVRDDIGGQVTPLIVPAPGNPVFAPTREWLLHGGCPRLNDFDAVLPRAGTVTLANFTGPDGVSTPYPYPAATLLESGTTRAITLPYDLSFVMGWDKTLMPRLPRMRLLEDVADYFDIAFSLDNLATPVPAAPGDLAVSAHPNPFNPSVELRYTLARPGHLAMKIYDTRGALVRTLVDGPVAVTRGVVVWDGADDRGGQAASGLYFAETRADGQVDVRKVTMLK